MSRPALADGGPCATLLNPPGWGYRFVCTSSSAHTIDHPGLRPVASDFYRTRITARRESENEIFDVTIDSFTAPSSDPAVRSAFAQAAGFVAGPSYSVDAPALVASSTSFVTAEPAAIESVDIRTATFSYASSAGAQTFCVGDLGDLPFPAALPQAPCAAGQTAVTLRPLDTSPAAELQDRLDDTHVHVQTDRYPSLLVTGTLTTSRYDVVARWSAPCSSELYDYGWGWLAVITCSSKSHHTVSSGIGAPFQGPAWSTRITGRLQGLPPLYDVTITANVQPLDDDAVRQALRDARAAVLAAAGPGGEVNGPTLVSSSSGQVTGMALSNFAKVKSIETEVPFPKQGDFCVGDYGDLPEPPSVLSAPPCPAGSSIARLPPPEAADLGTVGYSNHTHVERDIFTTLSVAGTLTSTHYAFVGQARSSTSTLTIPIVLSSTGGSAFTSELTLANRGTTDALVSFAYTPAFGGTPGTVTDVLPAERQRVIPDAIAYLRDLGLANPGSAGTLRASRSNLSSPDEVSAVVRTTSPVPEGRVGVAYPGLPPSTLLTSSALLCGLRQTAPDHSNVAVLNAGGPADGDVTLRLTVVSGDPSNPSSKVLPDVTLSPGAFSQLSSVLGTAGISNGYVRVERISGSAPYHAYAVVNDNESADGSYLGPVPASPAAPVASLTLPALVETPAYATELMLTNTTSDPRMLDFLWVSSSLAAGRASFSIALLPGEQQILSDFVQRLRDHGVVADPRGKGFEGALFVTDRSGDLSGVFCGARVTTAGPSGRYGVFLPAAPSGSEATGTAWLCGLQQTSETRSNLAIVNAGSVDDGPDAFRVDVYDGATWQVAVRKEWCARGDSNAWPSDPESDALSS